MMENKLTSEDYKRLAKEAAEQEKSEKQERREEESQTIERWNSFVKAEQVLMETDMKFYRDSQPKYFRKLQTKSWKKKTNPKIEYLNTEVKFYPPGTLGENWIQLKHQNARDMFRIMVEGGDITVKNPETGEVIKQNYPSRVYDKITNTLKEVDNKTYNMLDLSDKLEPNYGADETPECPIIHKALFYAVSGNVPELVDGIWIGQKLENLEWLEKWLYGTIHADIGNNMASFPVIFGPGKVGRNALFDVVLKQCLGKDACFSGTWDIIHGNFDGYKLGKVVMFIDEVPEKGSWEILKNMTGSTDSFVKQKYGAEFVIDNTVRYAIGTNEEIYPLPVENGPQMMRVSPIKTNRNSTFAENTVKMLDHIHGEGYCRQLLKDSDETLKVDDMTDFMVGDTLLRSVLQHEWASREACQKLLNYLDHTYASDTGNYSLGPLRGQDWDIIIRDKVPAVKQVVDYILDQEIETISVGELYEIYKVIQNERSDMVKKMSSFSQIIRDLLEDQGYTQHKETYINSNIRTTIYHIGVKDNFKDYNMNIDRFIMEVNLSDNINGPKHRKLRYNKDGVQIKTDSELLRERFLEMKKNSKME